MLDEFQRVSENVVERVRPSLVRIDAGGRGGNGVVVADHRIVTNAHNVDGDSPVVTFSDGSSSQTRVAGIDFDGDLAVLESATGAASALDFSPNQARLGQPVFAVAAAERGPRVTFGVVSAVGQAFRGPHGRRISGSVEHTAHLAAGSSGSSLVDAQGRLLGINTVRVGGGFYWALPADDAFRARISLLASGNVAERPRLGVTVAPAWAAQRMRAAVGLAPRSGLLVRDVEPDSPAARAGISVGDLLVAVDGRTIADTDDLAAAIEPPTATLRIDIVRGERALTVTASVSG